MSLSKCTESHCAVQAVARRRGRPARNLVALPLSCTRAKPGLRAPSVVKVDTERCRSSVPFPKHRLRGLFLQDISWLACGMHKRTRHAQESIAQPRYRLRTGTQVRERCRDRARGAVAASTRGALLRTSHGTLDCTGAIGQRAPLIRSLAVRSLRDVLANHRRPRGSV